MSEAAESMKKAFFKESIALKEETQHAFRDLEKEGSAEKIEYLLSLFFKLSESSTKAGFDQLANYARLFVSLFEKLSAENSKPDSDAIDAIRDSSNALFQGIEQYNKNLSAKVDLSIQLQAVEDLIDQKASSATSEPLDESDEIDLTDLGMDSNEGTTENQELDLTNLDNLDNFEGEYADEDEGEIDPYRPLEQPVPPPAMESEQQPNTPNKTMTEDEELLAALNSVTPAKTSQDKKEKGLSDDDLLAELNAVKPAPQKSENDSKNDDDLLVELDKVKPVPGKKVSPAKKESVATKEEVPAENPAVTKPVEIIESSVEKPATLRKTDHPSEILEFCLGPTLFGLPLVRVVEVMAVPYINPIPQSSEFQGVINKDGQAIAVVDLREKLNIPKGDDLSEEVLVLIEVAGEEIGLRVDRVTQPLNIEVSHISPLPGEAAGEATGHLTGIFFQGEIATFLIDIDKILEINGVQPSDLQVSGRLAAV